MPERGGHGPRANCLSPTEFLRLRCPVSVFGPWCWRVEVGVCRGEIDVAAGWEE